MKHYPDWLMRAIVLAGGPVTQCDYDPMPPLKTKVKPRTSKYCMQRLRVFRRAKGLSSNGKHPQKRGPKPMTALEKVIRAITYGGGLRLSPSEVQQLSHKP